MGGSYYDVAQICLNGHVVNSCFDRRPQHNKAHCDRCGEKTITQCPGCKTTINGAYILNSGSVMSGLGTAPAFCRNCGRPFPWTESKLKAAQELSQEIEGISNDEKKILMESIDDLVRDNPRTTLAATRFKKIVAKAGGAIGGSIRDILVDIVSETAKKALWPGT